MAGNSEVFDNLEETKLIDFILPISIEEYIGLFWDESNFHYNFLLNTINETKIEVTLWEKLANRTSFQRSIDSMHPLPYSLPWLPLSVKNHTLQTLHTKRNLRNNDLTFYVTEDATINGIPYSEPHVISEWKIESNHLNNEISIIITLHFQYDNTTMLESLIESNTKRELKKYYELYESESRNFINNLQTNRKIKPLRYLSACFEIEEPIQTSIPSLASDSNDIIKLSTTAVSIFPFFSLSLSNNNSNKIEETIIIESNYSNPFIGEIVCQDSEETEGDKIWNEIIIVLQIPINNNSKNNKILTKTDYERLFELTDHDFIESIPNDIDLDVIYYSIISFILKFSNNNWNVLLLFISLKSIEYNKWYAYQYMSIFSLLSLLIVFVFCNIISCLLDYIKYVLIHTKERTIPFSTDIH